MVTIGMNYRVRAGKEQVFEDAFARVLEAMRGVAGHAESHLYREVGDGARSYLIVSRWTSEDAFRGFVRSERFASQADHAERAAQIRSFALQVAAHLLREVVAGNEFEIQTLALEDRIRRGG